LETRRLVGTDVVTKHRMELFSDGVFVIVLTLLVLDLKPPEADGWAGLLAIAPGLAVHAMTFLIVGVLWLGHHNFLSSVEVVSPRTLLLNLLTLFWVTLIPFGARIAAEHPLGHLGIGLITACRGFYGFSQIAMIRTTSRDAKASRGRRWVGILQCTALLLAAALCAISPWFGYAMIPTLFITVIAQLPAPAVAPQAAETPEAEAVGVANLAGEVPQ
jgi:uncharacterized membrane protein